jgi:aryl-alcohol dehydrogenase
MTIVVRADAEVARAVHDGCGPSLAISCGRGAASPVLLGNIRSGISGLIGRVIAAAASSCGKGLNTGNICANRNHICGSPLHCQRRSGQDVAQANGCRCLDQMALRGNGEWIVNIRAAIVRQKSGPFLLEDIELQEPRHDEIRVKIAGCGICHTDLVCRDQYFPVPLPCVFGHEGSGIVDAVGAGVTGLVPGDHVVLSFDNCGACAPCLKGRPGYCLDLYASNFLGTRVDGSVALHAKAAGGPVHGHFFQQSSFATYALARANNAVKVDPAVPIELLGPLGCGIQTGAGAVMNALRPEAGSSIAIFGSGSVGLSAVMAAHLVGCATIIAVDLNSSRLDVARELGATHVVSTQAGNPVEAIQEISGGGVLYSLECTGLPQVLRQAVDALTLTGICGVIGVSPLGTEVALDMNALMFGRTVRGIIEGDSVPRIFIPQLVELYKQGRFPFDRLVSFYQLDQINEAVKDTESGKALKAIVLP